MRILKYEGQSAHLEMDQADAALIATACRRATLDIEAGPDVALAATMFELLSDVLGAQGFMVRPAGFEDNILQLRRSG